MNKAQGMHQKEQNRQQAEGDPHAVAFNGVRNFEFHGFYPSG
jgi:hypothetical protein